MDELFRGWRRKLALLMLVMDMVVVLLWLKSHFHDNFVDLIATTCGCERLISTNGHLRWESFHSDTPAHYFPTTVPFEGKGLAYVCVDQEVTNDCEIHFIFTLKALQSQRSYSARGETIYRRELRGQWRGFGYARWHGWATLSIVTVPYWSIVLMLTLFSAVLLFFNPLDLKRTNIAHPAGEDEKGIFGEMLHGWRRKVGLITLMIACVLMVVWLRSLVIADGVNFTTQECRHNLSSVIGKIEWVATEYSTVEFSWTTHPAEIYARTHNAIAKKEQEYATALDGMPRKMAWGISYWLVTLPLTLLSLWLLLSKPHKSTPKNALKLIANEEQ